MSTPPNPVPCAIPPIPDPSTGLPTCPTGFYYDPVQNCCIAIINTTVNPSDPCQASLLSTVANQEIDFSNMAQLQAEGYKKSNIIERFIVALLELPLIIIKPLLYLAASVVDDVLSVLAQVFTAAQGEHASGFYRLAGALMEDMLNIQVDGQHLADTFASGGRVAAMRELGGKLVDTLASELLGVAQTTTTGAFEVPPGTGIGGLPHTQISEAQGFSGLKSFVGFMTAFAIREGNTDFLAEMIPHGYGLIFKDFAEDFAKNVGLGRLGRVAWKPLITTTVATPLQWALNSEYRPTLFDVGQAYRAWAAGALSSADLTKELARHGWSDARQQGLQWQHLKPPDRAVLRDLHVLGLMDDLTYTTWEGRDGRTAEVTKTLDQWDDYAPTRRAVLRAAEAFAGSYLHGHLTATQYHSNVLSISKTATGQQLLSPGEVGALQSIEGIGFAGLRKHLSVPQLFRQYEDGLITLNEFSDAVTALGYPPDEVQLLEQELLISAKRAADKAAKAATAAQRGRLAHLTVAQLKSAFELGLVTLDEVKAELAIRQYPPDSIDTVVNEFLIAAKLRAATTPKP